MVRIGVQVKTWGQDKGKSFSRKPHLSRLVSELGMRVGIERPEL